MTKCVNCKSDAVYRLNNDGNADQVFCSEHLPKFVNLRKHFGVIVHDLAAVKEEVKEEVKKPVPTPPKKKKEVVEEPAVEPVIEEKIVEETPAETAE